MSTFRASRRTVSLLALACPLLIGCAAGSGIEGTYWLTKRELPDGSIMTPPDIIGLMSYSKEYRNFNLYWTDGAGKSASVSVVSEYELTDDEYRETNIFRQVRDEIRGEPLSCDLTPVGGVARVASENGRIEFKLPLFDEPNLVFEPGGFTATRPGEFIDYWEKID